MVGGFVEVVDVCGGGFEGGLLVGGCCILKYK